MKRILIVDDDKDLRFNLSCVLKEEGHDADCDDAVAIGAVCGRR